MIRKLTSVRVDFEKIVSRTIIKKTSKYISYKENTFSQVDALLCIYKMLRRSLLLIGILRLKQLSSVGAT